MKRIVGALILLLLVIPPQPGATRAAARPS